MPKIMCTTRTTFAQNITFQEKQALGKSMTLRKKKQNGFESRYGNGSGQQTSSMQFPGVWDKNFGVL